MTGRTFIALSIVFLSIEFFVTLFIEASGVFPARGIGWIVMGGAWVFTLLTIAFVAALIGNGRGGSIQVPSSGTWVQTSGSFNSQSAHRDVNRLTQLAEEQALRERAKNSGW